MHNAGFSALGLNAVYVPLEASDADDFVAFAARDSAVGRQHHGAVQGRACCTTSTRSIEMARRVGAINTLVVRDGRWIGANTDVEDFSTPLAGRMALEGHAGVVLGAGGAARAVAVALGRKAPRSRLRAAAARREGSCASWPAARSARGRRAGSWDVLVNATPAGSGGPADDPMDGVAARRRDRLRPRVRRPDPHTSCSSARAREGCLTIGGLEMLVAQAERQFELWTGQRPPAGLFSPRRRAAAGDGRVSRSQRTGA